MKYFKIEKGKGYFLNLENEFIEIDKITKDDLLNLSAKAIDSEFLFDVYDENNLHNKAHQIIYKNLIEKFSGLLDNRSRFKDESERLYKDALEKYKPIDDKN